MLFHVGDRVRCTENYNIVEIGMRGIIVKIIETHTGTPIGVNWGQPIGGHECGGLCPDGYGYFVPKSNIEKVEYGWEKLESPVKVKIVGV
jgi:hypothetical protein